MIAPQVGELAPVPRVPRREEAEEPRALTDGDRRLLAAWAHLGVLWAPADGERL